MTEINANFKINHPTCPASFISYDSDEESFVVLGKSLINDVDYNSTEADSPNGNKTCEEAKRIIDEEIRQLSLNSKGESTSDGNSSKQNPFQQLNSSHSGPSISNVHSIQKKSSVFSEMDSSFKKSILSELESFAKLKDVSEEKVKGGQIWSTSEKVPILNEAEQEGKPLNALETSLSFDEAEGAAATPEDLRKKILEAAKENQKLKERVKQNSITIQEQCNSIIEWQNVIKLREAHKQLLEVKEHIDKSVAAPPSEDLQKKILEIVEENQKLKETVKHNSVTMQEQCNRIIEWQDEVKKVHEAHKQKLLEAKEHIDKLTYEKKEAGIQIAALQDELNSAKMTLAEIQIVQNQVHQSRSAAYVEINSLKAEIRKLQQIIEELQQKSNNANGIGALKTQVSQENKEDGNYIAVLQDELNRTKTALAEIQIVQTEVQESRSAAYIEINSLKAEILKLQQTIEELQKKPISGDEIYVLETQLEIYKADFEAERRAKESIKEEKEKLTEDLQNLQRRNQQLQERIDLIDRDFVMYESREPPNREGRSNAQIFACPKCSHPFSDVAALQAHCDVCIT